MSMAEARNMPSMASRSTTPRRFLHWLCLWTVIVFAMVGALLGPASGEVWARGGHLTPEQWHYHLQLEEQGLLDHHELDVVSPPGTPLSDAQIAIAVLERPVVSAPSGAVSTGMPMVALLASPIDHVNEPASPGKLVTPERIPRESETIAPLLRPPITACVLLSTLLPVIR
jgi:hypothetical protein